ncbi:hypothetical protein C942_04900 [Photobacterium marinum]|uniref:ATP-grasp domain-containing protein n=1 Tax=Photobacterium marinum TaxID=1056511 RepID=L8JDA7_9GAMM|nr:ATP-grasp domain-containing protein [Photobacterium marinum]ELR66238.1 hypothetical protein C942_04900 [Photobacterium marinum]
MKEHDTKEAKYVVIVDPFSTSNVLAKELKGRGYKSIALISKNKIPDVFSGSYEREDFILELRFNDNFEEIIGILKSLNIKAVISCLETSVVLADKVAYELNLKGNNPNSSNLRRDKYKMGEALRHAGLRAVKQQLATSKEEVYDWLEEHKKFPVVVKPVKSAGSDSVVICHNLAEVDLACNDILGSTNKLEESNTEVLIQEFLAGNEYVVDTVTLDGYTVTTNVFVYEKTLANGADFVYRAIRALDRDSRIAKQLIKYNDEVLKAVGVEHGAGHSEIIIENDEPCLVEVGARLHGGNIPTVVQKCAPWSQIELLLDSHLDTAEFYRKMDSGLNMEKNILIHFYISNKEGTVKKINERANISSLSSFIDAIWYVDVGKHINKTIDLYTCPLKVILANEDEDKLLEDRDTLISMEKADTVFVI